MKDNIPLTWMRTAASAFSSMPCAKQRMRYPRHSAWPHFAARSFRSSRTCALAMLPRWCACSLAAAFLRVRLPCALFLGRSKDPRVGEFPGKERTRSQNLRVRTCKGPMKDLYSIYTKGHTYKEQHR